jgi:hypothetical protein
MSGEVQSSRASRNGLRTYAEYVFGLVLPGEKVALHVEPDAGFEAPLEGWTHEDLTLMIAEGRRQFDEQVAHLERIRGRAQWLFSTGLALGAVIAAVGAQVFQHGQAGVTLIWVIGIVTATWALLGAVAILTVRADFEGIATKVLADYPPPVEEQLARDYAEMLEGGDLTVNTVLTLFRQAVLWMIVGSYATLLAFLLSR